MQDVTASSLNQQATALATVAGDVGGLDSIAHLSAFTFARGLVGRSAATGLLEGTDQAIARTLNSLLDGALFR